MEWRTDALVLRTADYGENDKMLTLLTADRGKLAAGIKGVRKAGAKLRFAAQPFCFAEYVLATRGGRNTVASASLYDGFYPLRENVNAYYAAAVVMEACDKLMYEGEPCGALFVAAVTALKELCAEAPAGTLVKFLLAALAEAGYPVKADLCPVCGRVPAGRMRFDMESGAFTCADCSEGAPASEVTYRAVRAALGEGEGSQEGETRALRLLKAYFANKTDGELKALVQYLALPQ